MTVAQPQILRAHAEQSRADELAAIARLDDRQRPPGWRLSPWAVVTFVIGGRLDDDLIRSERDEIAGRLHPDTLDRATELCDLAEFRAGMLRELR